MNLSNENRLLLLCAQNAMRGGNHEEFNSLLSHQIKWDELLSSAISQGITPLVHKGLKDIPEKDRVPEEIRSKLREAYHGNVARNMYLYAELERVLRVLNENGIEVMVLKGAALAEVVYGDIGLRQMGDIDLLVKEESLPRVKAIMSGLDYEVESNSKPEDWYRTNHFHLPPFIHKEKSILVEIHWKVCADSLGIRADRWWGRARTAGLKDIQVLIPSPEDMILHICVSLYHGSYNKAALRGLCDIMYTIRYYSNDMDWDLFREAVAQSKIARPVYSLLFLIRKYFNRTNQLLSWLDPGHVDLKFSAMMGSIIFSSGEVSYGILMQSLVEDTLWKKAKKIFKGLLFLSREEMSKRYPVQSDSARVYLYYVYRPFALAVKYWRSAIEVFRIKNSC